MEMTHIAGNSYTADLDGTHVCIYMLNDADAVFIDTGEINDNELLRFLRVRKIRPKAIINTHLHIDHIGNNRALCSKYGCKVYCSPLEVRDRCSGCADFSRFLVKNVEEGTQVIEGAEFRFIPTPGHSVAHQSVVTPDGVCCLGDAALSMSKLKKSRIPYIYDAENAHRTLEKLLEMEDFPYYLAAHNGLISARNFKDTIRANIKKEEKLREIIMEVVGRGITTDNLKEKIMRAAGVTNPTTLSQFWMHDSVETRIKELVKEGRIRESEK